MTKLVLCSASPRRRDFLSRLGIAFESVSPDVDEARLPGETPRALAERLACKKALAGAELVRARGDSTGDAVALAADTVVAVGDVDLAKPVDRADAMRMIGLLAGREHVVISGVAVLRADGTLRSATAETRVWFRPMSAEEIAWLADSGDGDGKAGGYAVQGLASTFISRLDGSVTNVVGLPLPETIALLVEAGVPMPWGGP